MGSLQQAHEETIAGSSLQAAHQATLKTIPKKQIEKPPVALTPWESLVHGIDQAGQFLDRVHSATNTAANEFASAAGGAMAANPTPAEMQAQGANPLEAAVTPLVKNVQSMAGAVPKAVQAGTQAYQENKKQNFAAFTNAAPDNASTSEQLLRRALDLSFDVQTDPVALAQQLGISAAVKGAKAGLGAAKQLAVVQRGLARANAVVDPLAASVARSAPGAFVTRMLGNFGAGPHQAMRREIIRPYDLEITNALRPSEEVLSEVQRETLRLRKAGFDTPISDYAQQNNGASPVEELLRNLIKERATAGTPIPFNQLTPVQKGAMVKKLSNPYGVSPTWLIQQADKTLASMDATDFALLKAGKPAVYRPGTGNKTVDVDAWLETMFGKPAAVRPSTPGALARGSAQIPQVREAGFRNLLNDLPNHADWVKPLAQGQAADPGWVAIPNAGLLGSKLGGMQVPAPLKAFLDTETAAAGLGVSNEPKSWYIQNKDWIEWLYKNGVGTVKKGLIAGTSTQTANLMSNNLVSQMALKSKGLKQGALNGAGLKQAFQDVMRMDQGKTVAKDIQELRQFSNSFDATEKSSNFFGGPPRPAMEGKIIGAGKPGAFRAPTLGEAAGAVYPPNHVVEFQGLAERGYKLATYRALRNAGVGAKEAAATVEKYLFDYSDRGPLLEIADKFGLWPFATYPTKAFGLLMDTIVNHPEMLVKFPRLQALAKRGYEMNLQNVDPRYLSAATIPFGKPEDKRLVDFQRFLPFGAGLEGLTNLAQGNLGEAATSAVGLGRAGENPLESIINAPLGSRLYGIAQGISPFSEAGKPKGLLAPGEPASDLPALQRGELAKNYLPSQLGGRGTIAGRDVAQGKTSTDAPFTQSKSPEDVGLQHLLGIRTFNAQGPTEKKKNAGIKEEVKSRASDEVMGFLKQAKVTAEKSAPPEEIQKDAAKFNDPGQIKREILDAKGRLKNLPISGRVSVKGKLTAEGRDKIQRQLFYIYALKSRLKEVVRGQ